MNPLEKDMRALRKAVDGLIRRRIEATGASLDKNGKVIVDEGPIDRHNVLDVNDEFDSKIFLFF